MSCWSRTTRASARSSPRHLAAKGFRGGGGGIGRGRRPRSSPAGLRPASSCWTSTCPATPAGSSCGRGPRRGRLPAGRGRRARRRSTRAACASSHVAGYLPKPFAMETLVATVERIPSGATVRDRPRTSWPSSSPCSSRSAAHLALPSGCARDLHRARRRRPGAPRLRLSPVGAAAAGGLLSHARRRSPRPSLVVSLARRRPSSRRSSAATSRRVHGRRAHPPEPGRCDPVERGIYRVAGIDEAREQGWRGYAVSVLAVRRRVDPRRLLLLRVQDVLPLNPTGPPPMSPDLAFNTVGQLRDQHELAELRGRDRREPPHPDDRARRPQLHVGRRRLAIAIALRPRADAATARRRIGNYWVDVTAATLYILLPIAVVAAIVLVWQGVPQTFDGPLTVDRPSRARSRRSASRPHRLAGGDQGAGHQWRWLRQRQLRPSLREPHRAHQLPRDVRSSW